MKASYTIIVHGAHEPMPQRPAWLRNLIHKFYGQIGIKSGQLRYMNLLAEYLRDKGVTVVEKFYWSSGWTRTFGCRPAARDLAKHVSRQVLSLQSVGQLPSDCRIQMFGKSNGGLVCQMAARLLASYSPSLKVDTIVQVAVPNRSVHPELGNVRRIVNIYSPDDIVCRFAIRLLAPLKGTMWLAGDQRQVVNIRLDGFGHSTYNRNRTIDTGEFA